jgi:hypothetical protein
MTSRLSVFTPSDKPAVVITGCGWSKKPARNWGMPANENVGYLDHDDMTYRRDVWCGDFDIKLNISYAEWRQYLSFTPTGGKR